jgi:hypothetical protein
MELYKKVKYVLSRVLFYGKVFANDVNDYCRYRIRTAEEAKRLLREGAKVDDMYSIQSAIHDIYHDDGKIKTYMSPSEYTLYDIGAMKTKLYYFNGDKENYITDEKVLKLYDVIKDLDDVLYPDIYCLNNMGKYQFYCLIKEGKNGSGDFVDDDMTNVLGYLNKLKDNGATWRCVTDVIIDIPDDVSTWVITFTID